MKKLEEILTKPEDYMLQAGGEYEIIGELCSLRLRIKYEKLKVIVYGIGARGEYFIRWLKKEDIGVEFIIDQNQDGEFEGIPIFKPDRIPDMYNLQDDYLVFITPYLFEQYPEDFLGVLNELNLKNIVYPFSWRYGLPGYRYDWAYYYTHNKVLLCEIYNKLADEVSKDTYYEYIKAIVTNQVFKGSIGKTRNKYFECYIPKRDEVFLNLGAESGDTICQFIENRNEIFDRIIAVEGNVETYKNKLYRVLSIFPDLIRDRIVDINCWLDKDTASQIVSNDISLVNMDIEGSERVVLEILVEKLQEARPVFAICAYHKPQDIIELPQIILNKFDNYEIYFRKYAAPYSNNLQNGELVMYGVPKERVKR